MNTLNLIHADFNFNTSFDSRDLQDEIERIESLKDDSESDLETLTDELTELNDDLYAIENEEDYDDKQNDIDSKLTEIDDKESEIADLESLISELESDLSTLNDIKDEISDNSDEGFEYGIYCIHDRDIEDYLDDMLEECGYIPKDLPWWIKIDWQSTYDNMKEDYNEIEIGGNTFWVR